MSVTEKMWGAITTVIKMNDKVERLAGTVKNQQDKIENLTERLIRLDAFVEMALAGKPSSKPSPARRLEHKK